MDIQNFLEQIGLQDKLPFSINFQIKPVAPTSASKEIAGLNFPLLGSLTMREIYIFDAIDEYSGYNLNVAKLERILISMVQELSVAIGESDLAKCLQYVYETPDEIQAHENFTTYLKSTAEARSELLAVSKQLSNPSIAWAKATFFILSRADANWDFEKTTTLSEKDLNAILELIESEKAPKSQETEGFTENSSPVVPEGK